MSSILLLVLLALLAHVLCDESHDSVPAFLGLPPLQQTLALCLVHLMQQLLFCPTEQHLGHLQTLHTHTHTHIKREGETHSHVFMHIVRLEREGDARTCPHTRAGIERETHARVHTHTHTRTLMHTLRVGKTSMHAHTRTCIQ